jgi:hypothetical protein
MPFTEIFRRQAVLSRHGAVLPPEHAGYRASWGRRSLYASKPFYIHCE